MREVKLSTKNQIVIARDVREALGVKAGDRLLVVPRGNTVILLRKPKKYSNAIAGMAKDLYGSNYLGEERESWDSAQANRPISEPTSQSWLGYKRLYLSGGREQEVFQSHQFYLRLARRPAGAGCNFHHHIT
jgi:AbrB family looped-hinge helix DNA binding protein